MNKINKNISYLTSCKICGNKQLKKVLELNEQYISATFVKSNKENDLTKIKTTLNLMLCMQDGNPKNCGHLQLHEIVNPDLLYRNYFYRSGTSDTMRKDLKNVIESILKIIKPENIETTSLGAAYLAGLSAGIIKNTNDIKKKVIDNNKIN